MDTIVKIFVSAFSPVLLLIAQNTYQSLLGVTILANPFTIILFISSLNYLVSSCDSNEKLESGNICKKSVRTTTIPSKGYLCCHKKYDRIYTYHKYWLISTNLTLFLVFEYYVNQSLTVSKYELTLLYSNTIILLLMILRLKSHIARIIGNIQKAGISNLSLAIPLTVRQESQSINLQADSRDNLDSRKEDNLTTPNNTMNRKCHQICYLKMLAHPIVFRPKKVNSSNEDDDIPTINSNGQQNDQTTVEIQQDPIYSSREIKHRPSLNILRRWTYFTKSSSNPIKEPITNSYLMTCNFLHLTLMAQLSYLCLTHVCACNRSQLFGDYIIIPADCTYTYDKEDARGTMFVAIYAAQILLCHLVFMFKVVIMETRNNKVY